MKYPARPRYPQPMTTLLDKIKRHLDPRHDFDNIGRYPELDDSGVKNFLKSAKNAFVYTLHASGIVTKASVRGLYGGLLLGAFYDAATGDGQGKMIGAVVGSTLDGGQAFIRGFIYPRCVLPNRASDIGPAAPETSI